MTTTNEPKYRIENGRLVNRVSGEAIPDDEPIFILRARDRYAMAALNGYREAVWNSDVQGEHVRAVLFRMEHFRAFEMKHPERIKTPDTTLTQEWQDVSNALK